MILQLKLCVCTSLSSVTPILKNLFHLRDGTGSNYLSLKNHDKSQIKFCFVSEYSAFLRV